MQMKIFVLLGLLILQLVGCTRAAKDTSAKITIELPQSAVSASTMKLSHVAINATGAGISAPIVYSWDSCHDCATVPEPPASFQVEIPSGAGRLVQILAVYKDSITSQMVFYYGDSTRDFSGGEVTLDINISQVGSGNITGGRVSGRYLDTASTGPTSLIDIKYNPGNGKPALIVEKSSIVNGWFSFFMLSGANLQYVLRNSGTMLWGQEMSFESAAMNPSENAGAYFDQRVRAYIPVHIRTDNRNNVTTYVAQESENLVWGYWGAGATGKKVCTSGLDSSPVPTKIKKYVSSNLSSAPAFSVSHFVNHSLTVPTKAQLTDTSSPYSSIVVEGGLSMSSSCGGFSDTAANQYENFQKVYLNLFDGNGNDNVAGFRGIFRSDSNMNYLTVSSGDPRVLTGQTLPGVASVMSSLRMFKRVGTDELRVESPICSEVASLGFSPGSSSDATIDANGNFSLNSTISAAEASAGVSAIMCPLASGSLDTMGLFMGTWMFSSGGGGGGGGGGGTPAKVGFQDLAAVTIGVCSSVKVGVLTSSDGPATATSNTTVNLSASNGTFYSENDSICSGSPVSSVVIQANSSYVNVKYKVSTSPETNVTLTPASSPLTPIAQVVRARSSGSVAKIQLNTNVQTVNVGTCLPMTVDATESGNPLVTSHNGPVTLTTSSANGAIYTDAGCTSTGSVNFTSGQATFYIKGTSAGWFNVQASATIDSLPMTSFYGIGIVAANEPTHLVFQVPSANYMFINQCMPITIDAKDDGNTSRAMPTSKTISFSAMNGGAGNNFYTDSNCTSSMTSAQTTFIGGQNSLSVYYKPQNYGSVSLQADIMDGNSYLGGNVNYNIGNLWMHVIISGFNASFYDSTCNPLTFQLMDASTAGGNNVIPNLSGSPVNINANTNASTSNGGYYTNNDCSDSVSASKTASINPSSSTGLIYMRSLVASGPYITVNPSYSGPYTSSYQNGNTITGLSYAWCPPFDGGGACASSIAFSGTNVAGGTVLYPTAINTGGGSEDKTITLTNSSGSSVPLNTFTITGTNAPDYNFKGGSYPGAGGSCSGSLAGSGASCTIVVTFTPVGVGARYAYLNINYNGSVTIPLSLQGTGQ